MWVEILWINVMFSYYSHIYCPWNVRILRGTTFTLIFQAEPSRNVLLEWELQSDESFGLSFEHSTVWDQHAHMWWLLPVIFLLKKKLQRLEASCQMYLPLIRAIQNSLQKHFGEMMEEPQLIAAAILLPKFKTSWTDKADVITAGMISLLQKVWTSLSIWYLLVFQSLIVVCFSLGFITGAGQ